MALLASTIQTIMGIATGVDSSQTALYANLLYWIQHAVDDLYARGWTWNRIKGQFTTTAPYESGTITVADGSTTVTGSGTTFVTTWVDATISLNNTQHHIASADITTQLTLTAAVDAAVDAGSSYAVYFPVIELGATLARLENVQSYPHAPLRLITESEADDIFQQDDTRDYASHAALLGPGAASLYSRIALYPAPTEAQVYHYHGYRSAPALSAGTETRIPLEMRQLVCEMALAGYWRYQDKQEKRANRCEQKASQLMDTFTKRDTKASGPREIRGWVQRPKDVSGIYSVYDTWG